MVLVMTGQPVHEPGRMVGHLKSRRVEINLLLNQVESL